jgi:hypothetical protein
MRRILVVIFKQYESNSEILKKHEAETIRKLQLTILTQYYFTIFVV